MESTLLSKAAQQQEQLHRAATLIQVCNGLWKPWDQREHLYTDRVYVADPLQAPCCSETLSAIATCGHQHTATCQELLVQERGVTAMTIRPGQTAAEYCLQSGCQLLAWSALLQCLVQGIYMYAYWHIVLLLLIVAKSLTPLHHFAGCPNTRA